MNNKILVLSIIAILSVTTIATTLFSVNAVPSKTSALTYHDTWRVLWEDHIWWTRNVIVSVFDDSNGINVYVQRLLDNVPDMIAALQPFYGSQTNQLQALLTEHLTIAYQILVDAKAGQDITILLARWYQNANEIAVYMNGLNPNNWQLATLQDMWTMHLDFTLEEAVAHLTGNYTGEVAAFEQVHTLALEMADFISKGIIKQFPNMFISNIK